MTRLAGWVAVVLLALVLIVVYTGIRFPTRYCWDTVTAEATFDFYGRDVPAEVVTQCIYDWTGDKP